MGGEMPCEPKDLGPMPAARCNRETQGWQPFSTAPKDGTLIDVWVLTPFFSKPCRFSDCSWVDGCGDWGWNFSEECQPTHWMPVPSPPSSRKQRKH